MNPLVSLFCCLVARSRRQTDRHTYKPSTITLAAHARRGLMTHWIVSAHYVHRSKNTYIVSTRINLGTLCVKITSSNFNIAHWLWCWTSTLHTRVTKVQTCTCAILLIDGLDFQILFCLFVNIILQRFLPPLAFTFYFLIKISSFYFYTQIYILYFSTALYSNCHCDHLSLGLDTRCVGRVGMP